jgi:SecD/SecF fusion protein
VRAPVLGLDLRGGAEIVLEAQPERGQEVTEEQMDQAVQVLRKRVDALGVSEPEIRKEQGNRISIAVAGEDDPDRVFNLVGSTGKLYFIDLEEGLTQGVSRSFVAGAGIVPKTSLYELLDAVPDDLKSGEQSLLFAFDEKDTSEPLNPEGATSEEQLLRQIGQTELPEDVEVLGVPEGHIAVACSNQSPAGCPPNITPVPDTAEERFFWYLFDLPPEDQRLTGDDLDSARADFDTQTGQPVVLMDFDRRGGDLFGQITAGLAERGRADWNAAGAPEGQQAAFFQRFAIILDGELQTYPTIDFVQNPDGIRGGSAQITGLDSPGESQDIALVLQSGSLPVDFVPLSSSQVSATLGAESLQQGLIAGLAGLLVMILYLILFYRILGLIAAFALLIFAALFYGIIIAIPVTMTLPGIAGTILTIGVAADANIVIFERIREEFRSGKTVRASIAAGYSRGLSTILDANAVTLITAGVLFIASQSTVKGFALLLGIGVLVSMFTAVFATRAILGVLSTFSWFNNPRVIGAQAKPVRWRFDFAGRKRIWVAITILAIVASMAVIGIRGLNLGLDFTGGTRISIVTDEPTSVAQIRDVLGDTDGDLRSAVIRGQTVEGGADFQQFQVDAQEISPDAIRELSQRLDQRFGLAKSLDVRTVSASFGDEILRGALLALIFSLLLIVLYVIIRYDWRYALPMIVAVLHDLVIAAGVYAISGREVNSATIAALLTILGYSLYDTIIVFDRVRENERVLKRHTFDQIVNISLWETITRSLNTSFSTLLPIVALYFFGGETLRDFAFALLVGIAIGAYSSFFVATTLLAILKGRTPEYIGRKGSNELPVFIVGLPAAGAGARAPVDDDVDAAGLERVPDPSPAAGGEEAQATPAATATAEATDAAGEDGPDQAAIDAARRRRAERRGPNNP